MVDIKKKNRIIQAYYMKMEPGDLISEETELHKVGGNNQEIFLEIFIFFCIPGPGESQYWDNGESVQQQGERLCHDAGAQPGDQQEAAGGAGGHPPEEHHTEGEH